MMSVQIFETQAEKNGNQYFFTNSKQTISPPNLIAFAWPQNGTDTHLCSGTTLFFHHGCWSFAYGLLTIYAILCFDHLGGHHERLGKIQSRWQTARRLVLTFIWASVFFKKEIVKSAVSLPFLKHGDKLYRVCEKSCVYFAFQKMVVAVFWWKLDSGILNINRSWSRPCRCLRTYWWQCIRCCYQPSGRCHSLLGRGVHRQQTVYFGHVFEVKLKPLRVDFDKF